MGRRLKKARSSRMKFSHRRGRGGVEKKTGKGGGGGGGWYL